MSIGRRTRRSAGTTWLVALIVTGVVAACGGHDNNGSTPPTQPPPPGVTAVAIDSDVATAAGGEIASDIADYSSADTGGRGAMMPTGALRASAACTANSSTFLLVYGSGSDTLNIELTWYYFGPEGCQSTFSGTTTDSITYSGVDSLHINGLGWVAHSIRDRASVVTGSGGSSLSNDTVLVWSGVSQVTDTATYMDSTGTRAYSDVAFDTAAAITFAHPRNGDAYPNAGTVSLWYNGTLTVTGTNAKSVTVVRHVVATLNGTNDVPLQVLDPSSGALELTCTLDLTAHRIMTNSCH